MVIKKDLSYTELSELSTTLSSAELTAALKKYSKDALVETLVGFSGEVVNDKSTGTILETAAAIKLGATINKSVKHGCDCYYEDGNTVEIKPQNISNFSKLSCGNYASKTKLNMSGKYNDFRWHSLIRYILGSPTNSNETKKYNAEIMGFITKCYKEIDYRIFLRVACSLHGKSRTLNQNDDTWWQLVRTSLPAKYRNVSITRVQRRWEQAVRSVREDEYAIEPTEWNKYHASVGAVGGTMLYVAKLDFFIVYRRLFSVLLENYPPEERFALVKERSQVDFSCSHILKEDYDSIEWVYIHPDISQYRHCMSKKLLNIIPFETQHKIYI